MKVLLAVSLALPGVLLPSTTGAVEQPVSTRFIVAHPAKQPKPGETAVTWSEAIAQAQADSADSVIHFDPAGGQAEIVIPLTQTLTLAEKSGALVIDASGLAAPVTLDASRCMSSALTLEGRARLTLRNVRIRGAHQRNILVKDHAALRMEAAILEASQGPGLALYDDGGAELVNCRMSGNQTHGVELHDRAALRVTGGQMNDNRQSAIAAFQDSRASVDSVSFETSGQWHLFLTDKTRVEMSQCRFSGASFAGLDLSQSVDLQMRDCVMSKGQRFGVFATGRSRVRMTNVQLGQTAYRGLELQDESAVVLDRSRVESCGDYGAILFGRSRIEARESTFSRHGAHAVSLREQAGGKFEDCAFEDNRYSGIGCLDGQDGGPVAVQRSTFRGNGMRPIYRGPFHLDPDVPTPLRIRNGKVICQADPHARIDLFQDAAGEAAEYLRSIQADKTGKFEVDCRELPAGRVITASATVKGATSEFNVVAGADNEPLLAALLGQTGPLSDNAAQTQGENQPRCWPRGTKLLFRLPANPTPVVERYARTFTSCISSWTDNALRGLVQCGPPNLSHADGTVIPIHYLPATDPQLEGVGGVTLMRWTLEGYFVKPMEILLAEGDPHQTSCPRILAHEIGHTLGLGHARVGLLSRMQGSAAPIDSHLVNDFSPTLTYYDVQALHLLYGSQHRPGMTLAELIPDFVTLTTTANREANIGLQPTFSPPPPTAPSVSAQAD